MKTRSLFYFSFLAVVAGLAITVNAQTSGSNELPSPTVTLESFTGDQGQPPEEGSIGATIIAAIPEESACECGVRFEAKLQESNEWVALGLYSPDDVGDEYEQHSWALASNVFQPNQTYDIRVLIFDRVGNKSAYGTNQLEMTPYRENQCSDGEFANLKKSSTGEGENAKIILSWDKVCKEQREANRYKVFKNSQELEAIDEVANYYVAAGMPDGTTWKIEAYGEEPPNTNPSVIKTCDELVAKMRAKAVSVAVKEIYNSKCQRVDDWLRAIIEFDTYAAGYQPPCGPPRGWLSCALFGINAGGVPYFNFVTGSFLVPGYPNNNYWNAFVFCGEEGQQAPNPNGSVTDPWNQLSWTCTNSYTGGSPTYYTERAWVNFDLNAAGGPSIWPVTTTFTY